MSLLGQMPSITKDYYIKNLEDNVFNRTLLLRKLRDRQQHYDGGNEIIVPIESDELVAGGWYNGWDILDTAVNDIADSARYDWRQAYVNLGWNRKDQLINKGNAVQVVNLISATMKNATKKMQKQLTAAIFGAGGSQDIDGLLQLFAAGTTAWGKLTSTDVSTWAAQRDVATATLDLSTLNNLENLANDGEDQVNAHVTTDAILGFFYDLATPIQRLGTEPEAKLGFRTMMFNGYPVWADKACPAQHWFGINLDHFWLVSHPDEDFRYQEPITPTNQNAEIGKVYWMGNVVGDSRRRHFFMNAITA